MVIVRYDLDPKINVKWNCIIHIGAYLDQINIQNIYTTNKNPSVKYPIGDIKFDLDQEADCTVVG